MTESRCLLTGCWTGVPVPETSADLNLSKTAMPLTGLGFALGKPAAGADDDIMEDVRRKYYSR